MNLILLEPGELDASGTARVRDARAAHLRRVLKVEPGRAVRVGVLNGKIGTGTVTPAGPDGVTLACALAEPPPPRPGVDLLLAIPRPKVLNRLWAQLAAMGVGRIALTGADKVEPSYFESHVLRPETIRRQTIEGLQQAGDTIPPEVAVHRRLDQCLARDPVMEPDGALRIAADPRAAAPVDAALAGRRGRRVVFAIGPEGGWTDAELALLARHGFVLASLGPRILRADTACVALAALASAPLR